MPLKRKQHIPTSSLLLLYASTGFILASIERIFAFLEWLHHFHTHESDFIWNVFAFQVMSMSATCVATYILLEKIFRVFSNNKSSFVFR